MMQLDKMNENLLLTPKRKYEVIDCIYGGHLNLHFPKHALYDFIDKQNWGRGFIDWFFESGDFTLILYLIGFEFQLSY